MTTMITEVYEAFMSAGVDEEKARKAAEVMSIQRDDFLGLKAELKLHRWMLGLNLAFNTAIFWKVFL